MKNSKLTIYYDGLCRVCSLEIDIYKKKDTLNNLKYVDISQPAFDSTPLGISKREIHLNFHIELEDGSFVKGVPAFIEIWERLPGFWRQLAKICKFRPIQLLLELGYWIFARIRLYLPRKKQCTRCDTGTDTPPPERKS